MTYLPVEILKVVKMSSVVSSLVSPENNLKLFISTSLSEIIRLLEGLSHDRSEFDYVLYKLKQVVQVESVVRSKDFRGGSRGKSNRCKVLIVMALLGGSGGMPPRICSNLEPRKHHLLLSEQLSLSNLAACYSSNFT